MRMINEREVDFTPAERTRFWACFWFAVVSLLVYQVPVIGTLYGLLTGPFLMYMIFKGSPVYLLPLFVHFCYGRQQLYFIVFACFLYCLVNTHRITQKGLFFPWLLYLALSPFFIWYTWERYRLFGGIFAVGGTLEGFGYYWSLAPFFWAAIVVKRLPKTFFDGLFWFSFALFMVYAVTSYLPASFRYTRFLMLAESYAPIYVFWSLVRKERIDKVKFAFALMGSLVYATGLLRIFGPKITFTQVGHCIVAMFYLFFACRRGKWIVRLATPLLWLVLSTVLVFHTISTYYDRRNDTYASGFVYDNEAEVESVGMFLENMRFKALNDRGSVWTASWDSIRQQMKKSAVWVPPIAIFGEIQSDEGLSREIGIQAHNMLLELWRQYGAYGGLGLFACFAMIVSLKRLRVGLCENAGNEYGLLVAMCFGQAIATAHTGQYILNLEFGFFLFSLLGACYGMFTTRRWGYGYPVAYQYYAP